MPGNENAARWGQPGDGEEQKQVLTTKSYHGLPRVATAQTQEPAEALLLELRIRELVRDVVHEGVRAGGVDEAQRRVVLMTNELQRSAYVLELTAERMEGELL